MRRIAATLAYLVQKDKPLQIEGAATEEVLDASPMTTASGSRKAKTSAGAMTRYRIEVGRIHGVEPRHIVGAISNEAQLSSSDIGQIKLFDTFSLVDLPEDLPKETMRVLQNVWVCGQQLQLRVDTGKPGTSSGVGHRKKPPMKGKGARPFSPTRKKVPSGRRGPKDK